ncbi:MAG: TetR/AcrR family transcriptional regulator [Anaerolinea sp.]|nr:TetR/AcrR family transcriptional regulator [Anaerolinea sp.]
MTSRTYKTSQQTQNSILQKAVELFNESGAASISMSALAEAVGISAGNLQYHYKNKEELIRAIMERMYQEYDVLFAPIEKPFTLDTLRHLMRLKFDIGWQYRFFYREFAVLLRNDERLARRYREIQEQRVAALEEILRQLIASGAMRGDLSSAELHNIVLITLVLSSTWLSYIESAGWEITPAERERSVAVMVQHFKPYLTENVEP